MDRIWRVKSIPSKGAICQSTDRRFVPANGSRLPGHRWRNGIPRIRTTAATGSEFGAYFRCHQVPAHSCRRTTRQDFLSTQYPTQCGGRPLIGYDYVHSVTYLLHTEGRKVYFSLRLNGFIPGNPAAAQNMVAVIKNTSLSRRHGFRGRN